MSFILTGSLSELQRGHSEASQEPTGSKRHKVSSTEKQRTLSLGEALARLASIHPI
ncbi:hypothetical protein A2U01_0058434 [Trifolium medium]|uniref:Uncharacterized protein n=1 Tax=Trifolium medium TaxID=97028 RepID=A0A392RN41_9FABA|nr:hypothetical protein [Trifolium medium]